MTDRDTARRGPPGLAATLGVVVVGAAVTAFILLSGRAVQEDGARELGLVTGRGLRGEHTYIACIAFPWRWGRVRASDPETLEWVLDRSADAAGRRLRALRARLAAAREGTVSWGGLARLAALTASSLDRSEVELEALRAALDQGELEDARDSLGRVVEGLGAARDRMWALEDALAAYGREGD